jgi:hypothetical protein|tara:strand:+ start:926 stop:1498 length:573 start_codon:yes stop_codon:yes gene_type:complete
MFVIKAFKILIKFLKISVLLLIIPIIFSSCKGPDGKFKLPGADARKFPADPAKRVEQNLKEGKGFQLNEAFGGNKRGGVFDFASSNELWRASLDVIDFMPLSSVNYSGGIIITDWYSSDQGSKESIKISIRFLTNEIRTDALDIKVFNKICDDLVNCKITETDGVISKELKRKILKTATLYKEEKKNKKN